MVSVLRNETGCRVHPEWLAIISNMTNWRCSWEYQMFERSSFYHMEVAEMWRTNWWQQKFDDGLTVSKILIIRKGPGEIRQMRVYEVAFCSVSCETCLSEMRERFWIWDKWNTFLCPLLGGVTLSQYNVVLCDGDIRGKIRAKKQNAYMIKLFV